MLDEYCLERINNSPDAAVSWYLMSAYGYYVKDYPIISDGMFDKLANIILDNYKKIKHPHKKLISEEDLKAGTLLLKEEDYPDMCKSAYTRLVREEIPRAKQMDNTSRKGQ